MLNRVVRRLKRDFFRKKFTQIAQQVRATSEFNSMDQESELVVLSLVQKKDVNMYLLAVKTFLQYISPGKIVLVADPSIDEEDVKVLRQHIPALEITPASAHRYAETPVGGCWERLNAIASYNAEHYVIQLDADTLTMNRPSEVIDSVNSRRSFVLGTNDGQQVWTLDYASQFALAHRSDKNHIQIEAECLLTEFSAEFAHYVRGCAGFTGFAKNSISVEQVRRISTLFSQKLDQRWAEWGSEQFMSNLLVANSSALDVLPISRYQTPKDNTFTDKALLHFIGSMRFANSLYCQGARQCLSKLSRA